MQLLLVINVEGLCKGNAQHSGMDYNFLMRGQTKGIYNLRSVAMSFVAKPLARNVDFDFENSKIGSGTLVSYPRKTFVQNQ
jgi:hypothetical protein